PPSIHAPLPADYSPSNLASIGIARDRVRHDPSAQGSYEPRLVCRPIYPAWYRLSSHCGSDPGRVLRPRAESCQVPASGTDTWCDIVPALHWGDADKNRKHRYEPLSLA